MKVDKSDVQRAGNAGAGRAGESETWRAGNAGAGRAGESETWRAAELGEGCSGSAHASVQQAFDAVTAGRAIVIPTETVYGVAVDPKNPEAVNTVFKIKKRSPEKPLPILAARVEQLSGIVNIDDIAQKITDAFWPGELTIVFDLLPNANIELSPREFALDTVAVRVTKHPIASAILEKTGALATTSANISGSANLSSISEIKAQLGSNVAVYVNDTLPARPLTDTLTDTHAASAHTNTADTLPARPRTDPADTRLARPLTDSADTSPSSTTLTPSTIIDISQFSTERPFKVLREGNITKEQILRELN